jgi:PadR family transcriptional regulator PadR
MKAENAKAQMRKGILEYCILSILEQGDAYASDIINKLRESQLIVVEGTLYPLLTRQKNSGLLSYRWEESTQGPPRKYYELTQEGREFLKELDSAWTELVDAIQAIKTSDKLAKS